MSLVPLTGPAVLLMDALRAERVTQADTRQAIDRFLRACTPLPSDERQSQFDQLLSIVDESPTGPACFLAVVCGALLEQGAWPGRMGEVIHRLLDEILPQAAYLARECLKREQATIQPQSIFSTDKEEDAYYERLDEVSLQVFEVASTANPNAREAWDHLEALWPACIALYSRDVAARVRGRAFLPVIAPLADRHEGGHWLLQILPVLDQEPLLVIDPARRVGIAAKMSGVVDNFQLQTLLMDTIPRRWYERRRVSRSAVEVAIGVGPQGTDETITGRWNLYQATAIGPTGRLPKTPDEAVPHWLWGEGVPSDIAVIDGHRIVLLGPATYSRSWQSLRLFRNLRAQLDEVRVLDPASITAWLQRLQEHASR